MPTPNEGPFGAYSNVTEVVSAAAQTDILTEFDKLVALIPDGSAGDQPATSPEFDKIDPDMAVRLHAELAALRAAIDAAPTS